jgi:hypothetical protein
LPESGFFRIDYSINRRRLLKGNLMIFLPLAENRRARPQNAEESMDQTKQSPASKPEPTEAPSPASNERPRLRRSAAVREYITRMVAGMNSYKAKE